jgi:hypothetical protein
MEYVRKEFLAKEEKLMSIPDLLKGYLPDKEIKRIKDYMGDFFDTMKDTRSFKYHILDRCRTK